MGEINGLGELQRELFSGDTPRANGKRMLRDKNEVTGKSLEEGSPL